MMAHPLLFRKVAATNLPSHRNLHLYDTGNQVTVEDGESIIREYCMKKSSVFN